MFHSYIAEISVMVAITQEDLNFIIGAGAVHYDFTIREACSEGGFLYNMKRRREWILSKGGELTHERFTFRQLDLMCKAVESPMTVEGMRIIMKLVNIKKGINEMSELINDWLDKGIKEEDITAFKKQHSNEHE